MQATIHPSSIKGNIQAPSSKSVMQRALAAALLCKQTSYIQYHTLSADDQTALKIIQSLGATVEQIEDNIICVTSQGVNPIQDIIFCDESGLAARMFTPIAALSDKPMQIRGHRTLLRRPMHFFSAIFKLLHTKVYTNTGYLPVKIQGPLEPANIQINGSNSSQFLTGLLLAFSGANAKNISIQVNQLHSKPYIALTLQVMKQFGLKTPTHKSYEFLDDYDLFYFDDTTVNNEPSTINYNYTVEGDWSSAAFLLVAGAISGSVTVNGLDNYSLQADKAILKVLEMTGVSLQIKADKVTVSSMPVQPFHFDATHCPDLFPPLVALASHIEGTSTIKGVKRLINKESNRGLALQNEFNKLGVQIDINKDEMHINSTGIVKGAMVHSNNDHRIAMACAIAALKATDPITIEEAHVVDKSYPGFYKDLQQLGANIKLTKIRYRIRQA